MRTQRVFSIRLLLLLEITTHAVLYGIRSLECLHDYLYTYTVSATGNLANHWLLEQSPWYTLMYSTLDRSGYVRTVTPYEAFSARARAELRILQIMNY